MAVSIEAAARIRYFAGLSPAKLAVVAEVVRQRPVEKAEILFLEGDPCDAVYFVESGHIKIFKTSAEGREQVLRIMGPGDSFNEVPIFDSGPNPASAQAVDDGSVLYIRRDDLLALARSYPEIAMAVLRHFAGMLRHLTFLVEELSFKHVTGRLARVLLQYADSPGQQPRLTQQELASMVGTAREVVGRSLRSLADRGAIRLERGRIVVVDRERLEHLA